MPKTSPLRARVAFIEETLRTAGGAVGKLTGRRKDYTDRKGYLAEADLVAHAAIAEAVENRFPGEAVLSEEGDAPGGRGSGALWITDPVCGTTNYVGGIPLYTHSLSFIEKGTVVAAGIYHPDLDEMFLAEPGAATLNGAAIGVSETGTIAESVVALNCNQSEEGRDRTLSGLMATLAPPVTRRIRVFESANLELAWVACGRLDAYVNPDDKVWDIAAGSLLISAAGGNSRAWDGDSADVTQWRGIIAANRKCFPALDSLLKMNRSKWE